MMNLSDLFLREQDSLLLVVDIQDKLLLTMSHGKQVVENSTKLVKAANLLNVPILVTEHYPQGLGATVATLAGELDKATKLEKMTFSCCRGEGMLELVKQSGRKQLIICGMETHVCVLQTVLDLLKDGVRAFVVADAVCSRTKLNWRTALAQIEQAGGTVTIAEAVIFQWLERADRPEFKQALDIIK